VPWAHRIPTSLVTGNLSKKLLMLFVTVLCITLEKLRCDASTTLLIKVRNRVVGTDASFTSRTMTNVTVSNGSKVAQVVTNASSTDECRKLYCALHFSTFVSGLLLSGILMYTIANPTVHIPSMELIPSESALPLMWTWMLDDTQRRVSKCLCCYMCEFVMYYCYWH
jgi:hypothetical protein